MKNDNSVNIFIVDDDKLTATMVRSEIRRNFQDRDILFSTFESGELCEPHIGAKPDIAIIDYHMNSRIKNAMNGIDLIDLFRKKSPGTATILLTQDPNLGLGVEALTHGATDYVVKNELMMRRLNVSLYQCLNLRDIKQKSRKGHDIKNTLVFLATLMALLAAAFYFFSNSSWFSTGR